MKNLIHTSVIISASVIMAFSGVAIYSANFLENTIDENGKRQGYWVITGAMISDSNYDSSTVVEEGNFKDDLKTGVWKKYYPSGQLRSQITFSANKPVGKYTLYYENGVIEESGNWQKNKNTGDFARNYNNGNPHQKFHFADSGKRNGRQNYYHENGQLSLEVDIVNGKESGVMKRYDTSGKLIEEKSFNNGSYVQGSKKDYRKSKPQYVPEPAEVVEEDIESTPAQPKEEETNSAHHFKPDGHNVLYDRNKNISQSGVFKNGRLFNGKWYKYNQEGILLRVDIYRNGKFIGHGLMEN